MVSIVRFDFLVRLIVSTSCFDLSFRMIVSIYRFDLSCRVIVFDLSVRFYRFDFVLVSRAESSFRSLVLVSRFEGKGKQFCLTEPRR